MSQKKTEKLVLGQKQIISTSQRHAEHPFASQNTQQTSFDALTYQDRQVNLFNTYSGRGMMSMQILSLLVTSNAKNI